MALPFFYINNYNNAQKEIVLDEDTSKHIVQVLRMKAGEQLNLTDGKGNLLICSIADDHKKHCLVKVEETRHLPTGQAGKAQGTLLRQSSGGQARKVSIAISLLKNTNRFEWFLEKATEIGVSEIIPMICERTEKEKFRYERMQGIVISAMLQSQQVWLPVLHEPVSFKQVVDQALQEQKFIAHCIEEEEKRNLEDLVNENLSSQIVLVGPEGDFTSEEIQLAIQRHFDTVSLGVTRLRTETAGIVAAALLSIK